MANETSILLTPSNNAFGAISFDQIKTAEFVPAIRTAIDRAKENLERIKSTTGAANFDNTVLALETSSEDLDSVSSIFFNFLSAEADEAFHALAKEISPLIASYSNDVLLDEKIFARLKEVYENRESLKLAGEQAQLLDKTYKGFARNGALLGSAAKIKLREIDQKLALLSPQFGEHVLKSTNAYALELTDRADLAGLPEGAIEAAGMTAKARGKEGWIFTLDAPSYIPFLTYSERRPLREQMARAYGSRAVGGELDNRQILKEIASLRHERAQLLGFKTHADYVLEERMAGTPAKVWDFLNRLADKARPAATKEFAKLQAIAAADGVMDFAAWDFSFYAEKLKQKEYAFDEEALRPYFKLENVVEGVFKHAEILYNIRFVERPDLPVYHSEVKVYQVNDEATGNFVGLFYTDYFPRPTKRGGAWMTNFEEQGFKRGKVQRPHVSIVCNFTRPTDTKPSLLTMNEVRTLFHEFGHALHALLSQCTYRSIAGTNVYWDFVELPSQLMENWITEKEGLDLFAKHYLTGETMPTELVNKIKETSRFLTGIYTQRQVAFSMLDMAWHSKDPTAVTDVESFEIEATAKTQVVPRTPGTLSSAAFSHIFQGGYSAGYYSYKWAEVLEADAFEYFKEQGIFNPAVAALYKDNILTRGGTEHPMELYKKFRGREPDTDALLRRDGLL